MRVFKRYYISCNNSKTKTETETETETKVRQIKIFSSILKREVSDRLPLDFKKNFTTWKTCEVIIEMVYKNASLQYLKSYNPSKILFSIEIHMFYTSLQ